MSEARLRWTGVVFVSWIAAIVMANLATFAWVPFVATYHGTDEVWSTTGRIRMIYPVLGITVALAHVPIAVGTALAAREASRERNAPRLAVLSAVVLAILGASLLGLSLVTAALRFMGADLDPLFVMRDLVGSLLMLTLASSLALAPRARAAGGAAVVLLVASEGPRILDGTLGIGATSEMEVLVSAGATILASLAAWIAIVIALRRARPVEARAPSIAATFA